MSKLWSVFDGFVESLLVPNTTSKRGVHIHDAMTSKVHHDYRGNSSIPVPLGMYNIGYQHYLVTGQEVGFLGQPSWFPSCTPEDYW